LNIGTAKPSSEERSLVPHHLFDYVDPNYSFSVYDYQVSLRMKIEELQKKKVPIILVGGTGLYLKASLYDFGLNKEEVKMDLSKYEVLTNEELHKVLEELDLQESKKIHMNNRKRVLRAIEICLTQGKKKSELIQEQEHKLLYDVCFVGLTKNRQELYDAINKRVDIMFEMGLLEEVKQLLEKYDDNLRAFQAIGYKEIIDGWKNNVSEEEIKETIKKNSRRYAKRQYTYFENQLDVNWFDSHDEAFKFIINKIGG
jgi:tRNA dimethylallyltransferase